MSQTSLTELFDSITDAIHYRDGKTDGISAKDFPDRIRNIPDRGPLDPKQIYRDTRPVDWMKMPSLIKADEMYLLYHIPDGESLSVGFTVTCAGSYTVELGSVEDGAFTASVSTSLNSGATYEAELSAADCGELTSDGYKQVMVRVSGTGILTWVPSQYGGLVEIACRLPSGTKVRCGGTEASKALSDLRYFSCVGTNNLSNADRMYQYCKKLICVLDLYVNLITSGQYMFAYCAKLIAVPAMSFDSLKASQFMFNTAPSITDLSHVKMPKITGLYGTFTYCGSIKRLPDFVFTKINSLPYAFTYCKNLTEILNLNIPNVKTGNTPFSECKKLERLTLDPSIGTCSQMSIEVPYARLGRDAIVELLRSLPVSTEVSSLKLTNNPGVPDLTEEDKAIATNKNWTLVL